MALNEACSVWILNVKKGWNLLTSPGGAVGEKDPDNLLGVGEDETRSPQERRI